MLFETSCIVPGVLASTGVEAAKIVKSVVDKVKPDFVIAVDSLASRRLSRVGSTVQITDTGISPGSGIGNRRAVLNCETLGVPVVAIGIPTVVDAVTVGADILEEYLAREESKIPHELCEKVLSSVLTSNSFGYFVTPKDCDKISKQAGRLIAMGINMALNPNLSTSEIEELVE
jgi:spore protease